MATDLMKSAAYTVTFAAWFSFKYLATRSPSIYFPLCDPVTLTSDLILIDGRGIERTIPVPSLAILLSPVLFYRADIQTHRITHTQTPLNALFPRVSSA